MSTTAGEFSQAHSLLMRIDPAFVFPDRSIVARLMGDAVCGASHAPQPHLHTMQQLSSWTVLRAAQNESWCSALLSDGDKVVPLFM
jgi:hypothetical protein